MKEMNRRAFLTLTGAAVVALSLAGCDDGPYTPPAPPAPPAPTTSKEAKVLEAINQMLKEYWTDQGAPEKYKALAYSQEASDYARHFVSPCVEADKAEVRMTEEQDLAHDNDMSARLKAINQTYGNSALKVKVLGCNYELGNDTSSHEIKLTLPYALSGSDFKDAFNKIVKRVTEDAQLRWLGIYCPTVAGKDYIVVAPLSDRR